MSASYVVDLSATTIAGVSIAPAAGVGSTPASGVIVGNGLDFTLATTFCNVWAAGASLSGQFRVQVQTAPSNTSGLYTDPTSGLPPYLPTNIQSGGILICGSGANQASGGSNMVSGGVEIGGFLRPAGHAWVRAVVMSGDQHNGPVTVGFIEQQATTGSGTGYSYAPSSGILQV